MSSEESGEELGEEVMFVKPLPWRSEKFNAFISRIDTQIDSEKSDLAKRLSKRRLCGETSTRPRPAGNMPGWLFTD